MKLKTKRNKIWITIQGATADETAKFFVNPLTPKEINNLMKRATETEWEKGQRFVDVDFFKYKILKIKEIILGWEGVEDEDGNSLEFNEKNLENVYLNNPEFIDKVLEETEKLSSFLQKKAEDELKNLKPAQSGT